MASSITPIASVAATTAAADAYCGGDFFADTSFDGSTAGFGDSAMLGTATSVATTAAGDDGGSDAAAAMVAVELRTRL